MTVRFIKAADAIREPFDGRVNRWLCRPGQTPARILAILSPGSCQGPGLVDVSQREPWKSLRG